MCSESLIGCWELAYSSSPRKVIWHEPDMIMYSTGAQHNYQNGVLKARFRSENMEARANKALAYFRRRRLPMMWWVDPWSAPAELGDFLESRGLKPGWEVPCMAIDLARVKRKPLPAGLAIRPVENLRSLETCVITAHRGFEGGKKIRNDRWCETYAGLGVSPSKRWFTGFLDGRPVASSLLLLHEGVATIWIVSTLKRARGRGIGTAMTREPLLLAKELGYAIAIIQSSKMGLPAYERIGFKEYSRVKTYFRKPW